ncbi:CaiB/BaiF CoA-transferase family protein [Fulvivirgaceae bacterium BMA10]|uniref:CaiB/BaiF CoA-transferase family protein n=1 Tax=Splendidivirga corallicola TaxID=3051826 RepID=A0ABT8KL47_9BACT|nr:CaiB/BaiF CoA-transferase family protein [Fulvivirgaceae bacterium BMA10]
MAQNKQIFSDLKVLELASVLAGPSVGQFFAELGADVIKVENLLTNGDVTRHWKLKNEQGEISAYFASTNWSKKSMAIDLNKIKGLEIIHQLVGKIDVVIASYKAGDAEKLKVDYQTLASINPQLIYGQITGYGDDDPRTGYDAIIQAESGFMYMNGEPGGSRLKMPVALIDILAAHHLKEAVLIAMIDRMKNGKGKQVTVSLYDAAISSLANQASNYLVAGQVPEKMGSGHPNICPYGNTFKTSDDHEIILAVGTDKQFQSLCKIIECEELATNPKFANNAERVKNRDDLLLILERKIKNFPKKEILIRLHNNRIPAGSVNNLEEVFSQDLAKNMLITDHTQNRVSLKGVKNMAAKSTIFGMTSHFAPPPLIGEHTTEILKDILSYNQQKIDRLRNEKAIS